MSALTCSLPRDCNFFWKNNRTSVAHMDSPNIVDMGLSQMSSRVIGHNLDAELDVHLVGGFEDVSPNVWLRILYIIVDFPKT
ncbi:protein N-terminal asparagine amidohydrolase-like [Castanea sativa]|uniref:protein N-terminal asparagine amidohydrolase-like n=1 Tax=Castanea sativa TaxID=21020 RepID=UPI003F64AD9E